MVDLHSTLEKRNSVSWAGIGEDLCPTEAVGTQSLNRGCRRLDELGVVFFDRDRRFADALPELARNLAQHIEHVFFSGCLRLLFIQHISALAVFRAQPQNVSVAKARNRALEDNGACRSLADFPRDLRRQSSAGRPIMRSTF